MFKIVLLIFATIFAPVWISWILELFPKKEKATEPKKNPCFFLTYPAQDTEDLFCDLADDLDLETGEDGSVTVTCEVLTRSEKEQKAEFNRQQAQLDVDFLIGQLDSMYDEYHDIEEDMKVLAAQIRIGEAMHEVDKLKRHYKEQTRLNKQLRTVANQIHNTEKKLHTAQFKAGLQVCC